MVKVFNFGSINIDYVYRVKHFVQPGETLASESLDTVLGGKGANQSVSLARAGANVTHVGRVSESDAWAKQALADFGVDVSQIELLSSPSGHAIIQVDEQGENAIVLHGGANQSFDQKSLETALSDAKPGDWLLLQNECNALDAAFAIAGDKKLNIAFNPAPMDAAVSTLPLEQCKVLILNEIEAEQLAGTDELHSRYPDCIVVLTLGSKGAVLMHNGEKVSVSAPSVDVVDSTGAGDTFVGYFLAGIIGSLSLQESLERACAAGALAVTIQGATPSIPSSDAVSKFAKS